MGKNAAIDYALAPNKLKDNADEQTGTKNNKVRQDRYEKPGDTGGGDKGPTKEELPIRMYGTTGQKGD